ncbi:CdaR family transcriptional regulator [Terrabacter sp. MAHUQ-38]|uniref:PucR family transcriptional regulator n=1 Tax=unclassified Terrabacter TaxID=2630222 RepID=UPI00165E4572|nr:helix-turn-helix domain-containing protein [Terrabacter sp. MAHUQ-38]MBC9822179.1 helix-turn-helix domain-containing protein [Terrabacter sp. MAHUQ-38]
MRPEFQDIVEDVARLLARPTTLEDRDFNLVAFCSHEAHVDEVRLRSILQRHSTREVQDWFEGFGIATSEVPVRTPASPELGVLGRLCLPARWKGVTYGYLWLLDEHGGIDEARLPAAEALAERAGALMAQQARSREELGYTVEDLLSADPEAVERAAEAIHDLGIVGREVPFAAVVLRLASTEPAAIEPATPVPMNLWRLPRSVLAARGDEQHTFLVPVDGGGLQAARDIARQALDLYSERLPPAARSTLVVGVGGIRPNLAQARGSWHEARLATRVAEVVESLRPIATWPELGVYRLLACGPERALASAVLDPAVRRLLEQRDPDLRQTALVYLEAGGNVQETAAALNVHRQTVYYRLQKVEQVTGLALTRGDHRLVLHLGLTMAPFVTEHGEI